MPLVIAALAVAACGGEEAEGGREITVFAASSLTDAFIEMGQAFSAANPGVDVVFNFGGSSDLVSQIDQGAPADVFISADEATMDRLVAAGDAASEPRIVASNTFEIIVESGNPKGITSVADLAGPGLVVVLCADTVPCGKGAADLLAAAGVTVTPKSLEDKVKGVVTKVTTGEADAGIVFTTDVLAAGGAAQGVAIPADLNVVSKYPIVITAEAPDPDGARAFVEFVAGEQGQRILSSYGFTGP